jgi:hypothetical protein
MPDLATLKSRIASDLHRSNLTAVIASAITDAIAEYQGRRFAFNQVRDTFLTVAGQEFYAEGTDPDDIPDDIAELDAVTATINGRRCRLDPWSFGEGETFSTMTTSLGQPTRFAWYAQQIRLYPIPDGAYTVTLSYLQRIAAPASDATSNAWTTEAEQLIRAAVKKSICRDYLRDQPGEAAAERAETQAFRRLKREALQLDTGALAPSGI